MQYIYCCQKCNHEQEVQHKLNEVNKESCSQCNAAAEELKRIIALTAGKNVTWSKWQVGHGD